MIRQSRLRSSFPYPLKLSADEQHDRPHSPATLARGTIKVTFTVIKQDFTKDAKTTIFIFIDLSLNELQPGETGQTTNHHQLEP